MSKEIKYFPINTKVTNPGSEYGQKDNYEGVIVSGPVAMYDSKSVCYAVRLKKGFYCDQKKCFISVLLVNEDALEELT